MSFPSDWHPGQGDPLRPPGFEPLEPVPSSSSYVARHPTRYTWREDIEELIRRIYRTFGGPKRLHINTYYDHPEGWWRTRTSFDVWGPEGRGDPIGRDLGQRVLDHVFFDPNPPWIDWCIWQRRMWTKAKGVWEPFGSNPFEWHEDHPHFTFTKIGE